jgi:copper chaperone NosL
MNTCAYEGRTAGRRARLRMAGTVAVVVLGLGLGACRVRDRAGDTPPREISQGTSCALDGMLLADYPGPKAQIHYAGRDAPDFFCDTVEMFNIYLNPEQARAVRGLYVQDMGQADWDAPRGHWIDARQAYFVVDSRRHGSMGPTIASFSLEAYAERFAGEHGGRVVPFTGVTADKAVIDGGALHDGPM